jgi:hypothetical protein
MDIFEEERVLGVGHTNGHVPMVTGRRTADQRHGRLQRCRDRLATNVTPQLVLDRGPQGKSQSHHVQ